MTGALLLVLAGCGSGNKGEQAKADYNRSLGDSIEIARQEIDSLQQPDKSASRQSGTMARQLHRGEQSARSRRLSHLHQNEGQISPTSSGIVARINDNGQFELIAALNPGQFDQISVSSEGNEAKAL